MFIDDGEDSPYLCHRLFCIKYSYKLKYSYYFVAMKTNHLPEKKLVMDRTKCSKVDLGQANAPHKASGYGHRKTAIGKEDTYELNVFIDKCSVEIFLNGGKLAMTNLVFPSVPYNRMCFYSKGGTFKVDSFNVYRLGL